MNVLTSFRVSVTVALLLGTIGPRAAGCDPIGNVRFVCDQVGPEDLAPVPGSGWVLSSGMAANGAIRLINVHDRTTTALFPTATPKERLDKKTYDSCPGPIDPTEQDKFRAHGLYLRAGRNSVHTLYVVHHGNRESIEVFEFDARPKLTTNPLGRFVQRPREWDNFDPTGRIQRILNSHSVAIRTGSSARRKKPGV